jgi:hypothetical protein
MYPSGEKLIATTSLVHQHALLFAVLLLESILRPIGTINQFLKQQSGGKYVYTTCRFTFKISYSLNFLTPYGSGGVLEEGKRLSTKRYVPPVEASLILKTEKEGSGSPSRIAVYKFINSELTYDRLKARVSPLSETIILGILLKGFKNNIRGKPGTGGGKMGDPC